MGNFLLGFLTPLFATIFILSPSLPSLKSSDSNVSIISQDEAYAMIYSPIESLVPSPTPLPTITIPTPQPTPTPAPTQSPTLTLNPSSDTVSQIIAEVNNFRASNGLPSVSTDSQTCSFASTRALELASNFNHDGFRSRLDNNSLPYPSYSQVVENIAMTQSSSEVVGIWINSAGHAENMKKDTPFACVGIIGNYFAYEGWKP